MISDALISGGPLSVKSAALTASHSLKPRHSPTTRLLVQNEPSPIPHAVYCGASTCQYPNNATSTNTPAWQCIRAHESHDGADPNAHGNLYQFEGSTWTKTTGLTGDPGSYSRAVQDRAAL